MPIHGVGLSSNLANGPTDTLVQRSLGLLTNKHRGDGHVGHEFYFHAVLQADGAVRRLIIEPSFTMQNKLPYDVCPHTCLGIQKPRKEETPGNASLCQYLHG